MLSFCNPKDCSLPDSSVHRISQAKISSPAERTETTTSNSGCQATPLLHHFTALAAKFLSVQCHVLCCAQSLSHIRLFGTPRTVGRQAPLFMRISQARILEWVAMPSSRGSSQPRDGNEVSRIAGGFFTV